MVNIKKVGIIAGGVFFISINAYAGMPTVDAGNISGTISIVKNGMDNIKSVGDITGKVGELNTIVGDAAASISKFKEQASEVFNQASEAAQKAMARVEEAQSKLNEFKEEIEEQKQAFQEAVDTVKEQVDEAQSVTSDIKEVSIDDVELQQDDTEYAQTEEYEQMSQQKNSSSETENMQEETSSAMSSADRVYEDDAEIENIDGGKTNESINSQSFEQNNTVDDDQTAQINSNSEGTTNNKQFRVSPTVPKVEKISHSTFNHYEVMAFASSETGNSYIEDVYVVPMATRCEISAEDFIKNETKRNDCIETIIKENHADNNYDARISQRECQKMLYEAVVALMAEAMNAKYEAANYGETLDEQDDLASSSTDVRGDLSVIAESNYQTQILLNRMSMNLSSQIILDTAMQICGMSKDVLGESDSDDGNGD